jgi:hypothetical protein
MSIPDPGPGLLGRRSECAALDRLLGSIRAGPSRAQVLRGEAGVGKSALLEYLAQRASGCHVAGAAGVESEMELFLSPRPVEWGRVRKVFSKLGISSRRALRSALPDARAAAVPV